jgi:hypothetical protein
MDHNRVRKELINKLITLVAVGRFLSKLSSFAHRIGMTHNLFHSLCVKLDHKVVKRLLYRPSQYKYLNCWCPTEGRFKLSVVIAKGLQTGNYLQQALILFLNLPPPLHLLSKHLNATQLNHWMCYIQMCSNVIFNLNSLLYWNLFPCKVMHWSHDLLNLQIS